MAGEFGREPCSHFCANATITHSMSPFCIFCDILGCYTAELHLTKLLVTAKRYGAHRTTRDVRCPDLEPSHKSRNAAGLVQALELS